MDIGSWLQLGVVCLVGAMSPGPSLGLVVNNSLGGGRLFGILTSLGHGVGIGVWALLTAIGVAGFVAARQDMLMVMQAAGALLLAYIGLRTVQAPGTLLADTLRANRSSSTVAMRGVTQGFLLSILNPKIALFFLAIFSHFMPRDSSWTETGIMGATAGIIDALWYTLVAVTITGANVTQALRTRETAIRRVSGYLLLLIAIYLLISVVRRLLE